MSESLWIALAGYLYAIGSFVVWVAVVQDDDPFHEKLLAVFGWPLILPLVIMFNK